MADGTVAGGAAPRPISVILARLAQAKDADLLLREALDAAIDIAGADMGNIQLLEPANGSLKIGASRGFPPRSWIFLRRSAPTRIPRAVPRW